MKDPRPGEEKAQPRIVQEFKKEDFPKRSLDKSKSRPVVTPEMRETMNREVKAFGTVMEGANFWWQMDGSLNISLRQIAQGGDYIGVHKDIDFSVFAEDLPALREHVRKKGCRLFYLKEYDDGVPMMQFEEVLAGEKIPRFETKFRVAAVSEDERSLDLNVDLVLAGPIIHHRGPNGEFLLWNGREYPESWLAGEKINFQGVPLILSHPARFILNKAFFATKASKYHQEDLRHFVLDMRGVSKKDMDGVLKVMDDYVTDCKDRRAYVESLTRDIEMSIRSAQNQKETRQAIQAVFPEDYARRMFGLSAVDPVWNKEEQEKLLRKL